VADTIIQPLMDVALACLETSFGGHPDPPGQFCVRWGDHGGPSAGINLDECCKGLGWVRFASAAPTDSGAFPGNSERLRNCSGSWTVTLEWGVARCAPVGDAELPPTCTDWTTLQTNGLLDFQALRKAACCLARYKPPDTYDQLYRDVIVREITPKGPEGGCVELMMITVVKVVGCDEC